MKSEDIRDVVNWKKLNELEEDDLPSDETCTYIFKLNRCFGRLKGKSDILYIGRTDNLRQRIFENYIYRRGGETTQRIANYLEEYKDNIEIGWIEGDKERELLKRYEENHHELPPWNRQKS